MNAKIILGIIIPSILIIFLIVLSGMDIGFSAQKETLKSISYNSLFLNNKDNTGTVLQSLILKNDFFMPKRYEFKRITVCLNDKEGLQQRTNLNIRFNEGISDRMSASSGLSMISDVGYPYYDYGTVDNVEVPAKSQKEVKIFLQPQYSYNYYTRSTSSLDYDEILLIETNQQLSSYNSCANLESRELDSAIRIPIVDKPDFLCTETDSGIDAYIQGFVTLGNRTEQDLCQQYDPNRNREGGNNVVDFCYPKSGTQCFVLEKYCENNQIQMSDFDCVYGCKDGRCLNQYERI